MTSAKKGFSLIEILLTITILAIVLGVAIPKIILYNKDTKTIEYETLINTINSQLELYYFTYGYYPKTMTNEGWINDDGGHWQDFFKKGVPETDTNGRPWGTRYDLEKGRIHKK